MDNLFLQDCKYLFKQDEYLEIYKGITEGFGELAEQMEMELLAQIPLVQSVREAGDAGRPAVLQGDTPIALDLVDMTKNILASIKKRNTNLAPTKAVELKHSKGCSTK